MVPILHLPRNYWKLLGIKMLYVNDNFCAIDKYLKNDEKFKYFSLKYNMTSKSVKFFLFFELVMVKSIVYQNIYELFECCCLFCFLALKYGNFGENPTLENMYLFPVAMVTKPCKKILIFLWKMYTPNFNLYNCTS